MEEGRCGEMAHLDVGPVVGERLVDERVHRLDREGGGADGVVLRELVVVEDLKAKRAGDQLTHLHTRCTGGRE